MQDNIVIFETEDEYKEGGYEKSIFTENHQNFTAPDGLIMNFLKRIILLRRIFMGKLPNWILLTMPDK